MNTFQRTGALFILTTMPFCFVEAQIRATYKSADDDLLTIRSLTLLPAFDNTQGIYARAVDVYLSEKIKNTHRFEYVPMNSAGAIVTPEELAENTTLSRQMAQSTSADGYISTRITKGPAGISISMGLFLKKDALLIARHELNKFPRTDTAAVQTEAALLLDKLLEQLPYRGVVLSRQGTRLTINLGAKDNIKEGQVLSALQIISFNRHPKFNFIISSEKEILGQVRVIKVEDTLSFVRIVNEKSPGAIVVNTKIEYPQPFSYGNINQLGDEPDLNNDLLNDPKNKSAFGENPTEWKPLRNPQFGSVGARFGLGQFSENIKSNKTLKSDTPIYPFFVIEGEVWLNPKWSLHARLKQGILETDNPAGSGDLSRSLSTYEFLGGYNFRFGSSLWTPRFELLGGLSSYKLQTDKTTDSAITTKTYNGFKIGGLGFYPLSNHSKYGIGAQLYIFLFQSLRESPGSSGKDDNSVNEFGLFVERRIRQNLSVRGHLDFELYSSDFSGKGIESSSQRHTTLSAGIHYFF